MQVPWSAEAPSGVLARAQLRTRWRALLALGLLAGVTAGFAAAALGGGLRSRTALDRLEEREHAADAVVFPGQVGLLTADWDRLAEEPEIEQIAVWALLFGNFDLDALPPEAREEAALGGGLVFPSVDGTWLGEVGRPVVVEGRMYDPDAADEVVVDEQTPGLEVGDVVPFTPFAPYQMEESFTGGTARGPALELRVVGRVRTINQFLFTGGQVLVSPGVLAAHRDEMLLIENADVRLVHGADDLEALQRSVNEILAPGTPILDLHESSRRVETTTSVEWTALLVLAATVAAAGLILVGQAVGQSAAASVDDLPTIQALGMTRADAIRVAVVTHLPTAAVAAASALVVGVLTSIRFPVGTAAAIDPDRGVQPSWAVLVPVVLLVAFAVLGGVAVLAARANRARTRPERAGGPLAWVRRVSPLPVGLGTTMALHTGQGRAKVPVRQALVGAMVGILGVVGAMIIDAGLDDAVEHPERAGVAWDALVQPDTPDLLPTDVSPDLMAAVAAVDEVDDVSAVDRLAIDVDGVGVPGFASRPRQGETTPDISLVLTDGRAPEGDAEVALGPATLRDLDVAIGDTVEVGDEGRPMTVVGEALFPSDVHAAFDEGVWLASPGWDGVVPPLDEGTGTGPDRFVAIRFDAGVDRDDGVDAVAAQLGDRAVAVSPVEIPVEIENLRRVRTLPTVLAVFLALLAVAAVGHVLFTSARRRSQTFAVLRALGLTRTEARYVLNSQGTTIGVIGLLVGIPIGVLIGRWGWSYIAAQVPLDDVAPSAWLAVAVVVPGALLVANALALWPGRRVANLRPAEILRSE